MVQIVAGDKGKGKTKYLLSMANDSMAKAHGTVAYLDKSTKHMFELDRKIRLINAFEYPLQTLDAFIGFVCGIISQDHDLEIMYLDSFMMLTGIDEERIEEAVRAIEKLSAHYNVNFVICISLDKDKLPASVQEKVVIAL